MSTTATEEELVKIHFTFDPEKDERYEGSPAGENTWAAPMQGGRSGLFQVRNVPFFTYDVSFMDIVRVVETDDYDREVVEVVGNSGFGLVRLLAREDGVLEGLVDRLEAAFPAAHIEGGFGILLAIAVAETDIKRLLAFLVSDGDYAVEVAKGVQ
jgi:hypothetical protein